MIMVFKIISHVLLNKTMFGKILYSQNEWYKMTCTKIGIRTTKLALNNITNNNK